MREKVKLYCLIGKTVREAVTTMRQWNKGLEFGISIKWPKKAEKLKNCQTLIVVNGEEIIADDDNDDWYEIALNMIRKQKLKKIQNG
jgi:hypothetical protein